MLVIFFSFFTLLLSTSSVFGLLSIINGQLEHRKHRSFTYIPFTPLQSCNSFINQWRRHSPIDHSLLSSTLLPSSVLQFFSFNHARNVFTVPRIAFLQIGQFESDLAHISQHDKCPQGRNTVLVSRSIQTRHFFASFNSRFSSSSRSASSSVIFAVSNLFAPSTDADADISVGMHSSWNISNRQIINKTVLILAIIVTVQ